MTGKEDWEKKYREEIEEVNLRADMLCAWNEELEKENTKLKDMLVKFDNDHFQYYMDCMRVVYFLKDRFIIEVGQDIEGSYCYMKIKHKEIIDQELIIELTEKEFEFLERMLDNGR